MREITDRGRVLEAIQNLALTAELFEEQNGKQKYAGDLEVIVQGRDYGNGKRVGPYVRLLAYDGGEEIMRQGEWGGNTFYIAVEGALDVYVRDAGGQKKIGQLEPGACFGEMALLAGIERNATVAVPANQKAVVLEVTRPALRLLRKLKTFGTILDETYRTHGIGRVIEDLGPITNKPLSEPLVQELRRTARYMVYGKNHVLCQEDQPIDRLILIKSGWVRRSHGVPFHAATPEVVLGMDETTGVDFLGGGNCLGLEGAGQPAIWQYKASVMTRTEVLEIPLDQFSTDPELRKQLAATFSPLSTAGSSVPLTIEALPDLNALKAAEEEIATGIIDGTNVLVMDMDLCIRCGNCSLACHKVHGQSRLLRRGIQIERPATIGKKRLQHALVPQVCMHCADPECLTGCPTGAIFRDSNGDIDIDAATCIGCFDCATQCPYDAITMVPRASPPPPSGFAATLKRVFSFKIDRPVAPEASDDPVAIKCNLCEGTSLNPAGSKRKAYSCEENCPTGALVRVDPIEYFNEIGSATSFVFRDQNHAVGRNIHKSDPLARAWHAGGAAVTIISALVIGWAINRYGYDRVLAGTWLTMRWLTGLAGLAGIAVVMSYPFRKQIYRRRAGALRYWMLAHVYVGVIAGVMLLFHSGPRTGGLVTSFLYVAFDLTILSGIVGLAAYYLAPRIMTRIEGEPLLVEDLEGRRKELLADVRAILDKSDGWLKEEIRDRVYSRFLSYGFLWRQIWRREELKAMLAQARQEFKDRTTRLTTDEERDQLIAAVETAVTLRRVDALLMLHWLLRAWIPLHIFATAVMLALLLVHISQVVFFSVR
ncbi:MAG TPA: cyclic nucleotide-binding domain-containing protein [Pyrinomonadaceae bacterium]|jgi:Fe-S-cluster-containing dehydrogenase component/CRP-like cAMP-binding protein|nr:cyclic nucleotide-binding domain-containing protein [Pyrinomonadaceae bacterium]